MIQIPSFQEVNTAAKVAETLRSYGMDEVFEGVGRVSTESMWYIYSVITESHGSEELLIHYIVYYSI